MRVVYFTLFTAYVVFFKNPHKVIKATWEKQETTTTPTLSFDLWWSLLIKSSRLFPLR